MPDSATKIAYAPAVSRRPSLDFSGIGVIYISMMAFMGLAAVNSQANLLFGVFGLMIGILLISGVLSRVVLLRLKVRRTLPDHGVVGVPTTIGYQFQNSKWFGPSLSVTLAELEAADGFSKQPQAYLLHVAPGATASVPAGVIPVRRGLHQFDHFEVGTSFPFGFIKRAITERHPDRLLIYPPIAQVDRKLLTLCQAAEQHGASMRPRRGGDDEFYGVKEHRTGDNPRRIYWKRSARTAAQGLLVAKEMTKVAPPRLMLLVDTFVANRTLDEHAAVERAIAMAGSLATKALDEELSVGLLVWSGTWRIVEPTRGKRQRNDLLSILARLPLNTEQDGGELVRRCGSLKSGTTAVLISPRGAPGVPMRASLMTIATTSPEATAWFKFEPGIDFRATMPKDQQPEGPPVAAPSIWRRVNLRVIVALGLLLSLGILLTYTANRVRRTVRTGAYPVEDGNLKAPSER